MIAGAGFTYPVEDLYLEDVLRLTGLPAASAKRNVGGSWRKPTDGGNAFGSRPKAKVSPQPRTDCVQMNVCLKLSLTTHRHCHERDATLFSSALR